MMTESSYTRMSLSSFIFQQVITIAGAEF